MSVTELQAAVVAAKAAYKANKTPELKAAHKAAKAALAAAVAKAERKAAKKAKKASKRKALEEPEAEQAAPKKAKISIDALTAAAAAAKATYKANKTPELKSAYKAAKAALAAAQAEPAAEAAAEPAAEEKPDDALAGLKKKGGNSNAGDRPANANEKCFIGNLDWNIDDDATREFFKECGAITDIHWLTDRESGKFKGCGFITFDSVDAAVKAVAMTGEMCMGRDIKVDFATPRPGGDKKKSFQKRELSEKPDGCDTCFCGNLSYEIDDDAMRDFAKDCGEIAKIRWLTDRDSGDFKGCGFVEFSDPASVDAFVALNGQNLLGRAIRIDYAKPRAPKKEW